MEPINRHISQQLVIPAAYNKKTTPQMVFAEQTKAEFNITAQPSVNIHTYGKWTIVYCYILVFQE